jgi:four helix bundle protein
MPRLSSFRDLRVYQELRRLHLEVHRETMHWPQFERYELGSQIRRSSNSAPAIVAEGWGSRHTNVYIEAVNKAMGEARETQHHLDVACEKGYLSPERFQELDAAYGHCGRMLERLHQSLSNWSGTTRTGTEVREPESPYGSAEPPTEWSKSVELTEQVEEELSGLFGSHPQHQTPGT